MNRVLSEILGVLAGRLTGAVVDSNTEKQENPKKTTPSEMTWGEFTEQLNATTEQLRKNNAILAQMAAPFMEEAAPVAEA